MWRGMVRCGVRCVGGEVERGEGQPRWLGGSNGRGGRGEVVDEEEKAITEGQTGATHQQEKSDEIQMESDEIQMGSENVMFYKVFDTHLNLI